MKSYKKTWLLYKHYINKTKHSVKQDRAKCFRTGEEWLSLVRILQFVTWHFIFFHIEWSAHSSGALWWWLFKPVPEQCTMNWFHNEDASTEEKHVCKMIWWENDQAEKWCDLIWENIITCYSHREGWYKDKVCLHIRAMCVWDWADINKWHLLFIQAVLVPFHWAWDISALSSANTFIICSNSICLIFFSRCVALYQNPWAVTAGSVSSHFPHFVRQKP